MDRIDIQKEVHPVGFFDIENQNATYSSIELREKVTTLVSGTIKFLCLLIARRHTVTVQVILITLMRIAMRIFGLFNGVFMHLRFQMYIKSTESSETVRYSTRRI